MIDSLPIKKADKKKLYNAIDVFEDERKLQGTIQDSYTRNSMKAKIKRVAKNIGDILRNVDIPDEESIKIFRRIQSGK